MKTKYLLPHRWKIFGWILVAVCLPLGIWKLFFEEVFSLSLQITLPWKSIGSSDLVPHNTDGYIVSDILDEMISIGCIAGLLIVGFSRQLIEDERIAQLRLEALQWGFYANYLILALCTVLVYGGAFLTVMIYNMFTPLLIFVARFYWLLYVKSAIEIRKERNLSL